MSVILEFNHTAFHYHGAFEQEKNFEMGPFNLAIEQGSFTLLLGPNGAGKTTLFKLALGLLRPDQGSVFLKGQDLKKLQPLDIARLAAVVEQETEYPFPFTVEEVVMMGRFPHAGESFWDTPQDAQTAAWAMEATGVQRFARRSIQTLSGGEKRRVEIARALCQKPELLLLDEPAAFLDLRQQADLFELLKKLNRDQGLTILMISHQPGLARGAAGQAVFLSEGKLSALTPAEEMLRPESLMKLFNLPSSACLG